jgi:hypothetical protein
MESRLDSQHRILGLIILLGMIILLTIMNNGIDFTQNLINPDPVELVKKTDDAPFHIKNLFEVSYCKKGDIAIVGYQSDSAVYYYRCKDGRWKRLGYEQWE